MHNYLYLWLGSKRTAKRGVKGPAALLDRAAHAGLPVPPSILLLDDAWVYAQQEHIIRVDGAAVEATAEASVASADVTAAIQVESAAALHAFIDESRFFQPVTLQPAFISANGEPAPPPGQTWRDVDAQDPEAFAAALSAVWASGLPWLAHQTEGARMDVIIMEASAASTQGDAIAQAAYEADLVFVDGTATDPIAMPRLAPGERPAAAAGFQRRLQQLLRGVRRTLGPGEWCVRWADDGAICRLLAITPITDLPVRPAKLSRAPLAGLPVAAIWAEPLPPLMLEVLDECNEDWLAFLRQFDRTLPAGRRLVQIEAGRPALDIGYVGDLFARWGLPGSFVGYGTDSRRWRWQRVWRRGPVLLRLAQWGWFGRRQLQAELSAIEATASQLPSTFVETRRRTRAFVTHLGRYLLTLAIANRLRRTIRPDDDWPIILAAHDQIQRHWQMLAEGAAARGVLSEPKAIWHLRISELENIDRSM